MNRTILVLATIAYTVIVAGLLYLCIAGVAWAARNPKGNSMTFWIYLDKAVTFQRVPELQLEGYQDGF